MDTLELYEKVRAVPAEAQKPISAGRLRGMTDINPMWRIKKLTEIFGPCGEGWHTSDVTFDVRQCNDETVVICTGWLHTKTGDQWNQPIFGVGGSKLISKESKGLYVDDESYKKAYTDMLSVACKALGMGADVYWNGDRTKYTSGTPQSTPPNQPQKIPKAAEQVLKVFFKNYRKTHEQETADFQVQLLKEYNIEKFSDITDDQYVTILNRVANWKPKPVDEQSKP